MLEKDLQIDHTKHVIYSKEAKRCVRNLLYRYYDNQAVEVLWEKIQFQYASFLEEEPALGGVRITKSIYDPILIFAWYKVVPDKPSVEEIQQDIYDCFMSGFDFLGKIFNLNRGFDFWFASRLFQMVSHLRKREIKSFPASFRMESFSCDREGKKYVTTFPSVPPLNSQSVIIWRISFP